MKGRPQKQKPRHLWKGELPRLANVMINLQMPWTDMLIITAQVQLALRHPWNDGHAAEVGREFVETVLSKLEVVSPDVAKVMRYGENDRNVSR